MRCFNNKSKETQITSKPIDIEKRTNYFPHFLYYDCLFVWLFFYNGSLKSIQIDSFVGSRLLIMKCQREYKLIKSPLTVEQHISLCRGKALPSLIHVNDCFLSITENLIDKKAFQF